MSRREALQQFLGDVIPAFRDRGAWEDLAWNLINALTEEQLQRIKEDFDNGLMIVATDEWAV